jgi:hypothetical protein
MVGEPTLAAGLLCSLASPSPAVGSGLAEANPLTREKVSAAAPTAH